MSNSDFKPIQPLSMEGNMAQNWQFWKQKFTIYQKASENIKKKEDIQCAQLLHCIGDEGVRIYNTFKFEPEEINKIDVLIDKFEQHFIPRKQVDFERHKYFKRIQLQGESVDQYVTVLKTMALQCELGDLTESITKTILTNGVSQEMRKRILEKEGRSLEEAINICRTMENNNDISNKISENSPLVHAIHSKRRNTSSNRKATPPFSSRPSTSHDANISRYGQNNYKQKSECQKCGTKHALGKCPAYGKICSVCKKFGHFARMCFFKVQSVNCESDEVEEDSENDCAFVGSIDSSCKLKEWHVVLDIHGQKIKLKMDTGSMVNLLPMYMLKVFNIDKTLLKPSNIKLMSYTNQQIVVYGTIYLKCKYKHLENLVKFHIVSDKSSAILGLDSCSLFNLIKRVDVIESCNGNESIINNNVDLFKGIGCMPGKYSIKLKNDINPVIHPPRKVPLPLLKDLKQTLREMEHDNIIKKVDEPTEWVNSMVLVRKSNGSLRVCLDPKDLNKAILREHFQLPTLDQICSNLAGAKYFSVIDAYKGFWQILLDEKSSKLCTFNTPYGRYRFLRLPYGINSSSEVFHKRFKGVFNFEGVDIFIDDIIVWGSSKEEHDERLLQVFDKARELNIKFNKNKCQFRKTEIKFLGHIFTQNGMRPDDSKIDSIINMEMPTDKKSLQRFLGIINYCNKFIPNVSEITSPLRELLKKSVIWHWDNRHTEAVEKLKLILTQKPVLQFYDVNRPCTLSVDSSKNTLGAVLLQNNMPVAYASMSLNETQKRYAVIEKELLAILFACEHFSQYIYGKKSLVQSDHKPLIPILNKNLNDCPARLQRMLIRLQKFDISVVYIPGKDLFIADALSRANYNRNNNYYISDIDLDIEAQVCLVKNYVKMSDKRFIELQNETKNDEILSQLIKYIKHGWPRKIKNINNCFKEYFKIRNEISYTHGLLYKNCRIIVPKNLRNDILKNLHYSHQGIERTKRLARESVYWPNITIDVEKYVSMCMICQKYRKSNKNEPMIPHYVPKYPWQKLGSDIFTLNNKNYLIVIDYLSKYVEISEYQNDTTSESTIKLLKGIFSTHGVPKIFVSDGGPQYTSFAFKQFSQEWNFEHIMSSPTHSKSNGMVERSIQTVKNIIKKAIDDNKDVLLALLQYKNTPFCDQGSPAQILMSRRLRSNIIPLDDNLLRPSLVNYNDLRKEIASKQNIQKHNFDKKGSKSLDILKKGDKVMIQSEDKLWYPGEVIAKHNSRSYKVKKHNGQIITRNRKFLNKIKANKEQINNNKMDQQITNINQNKGIQNKTKSGRIVNPPNRLQLYY